MYKISEFSKITGLTVKALRYYDGQGLLAPSCRDKETSYRLYSDADFERAALIKILRSFDFSIAEIRDILSHYAGREDLYNALREKQSKISQNIAAEKARMEQIEAFLQPCRRPREQTPYEIVVKEIKAIPVISIRFQGQYQDLGSYIPLLRRIAKSGCDGNPLNCYFDEECKETADMEICLPVKRPIRCAETAYKILPAIKAVTVVHIGAYESLNYAYKAIYDFSNKQSIQLCTPSRELYEKGPDTGSWGHPDQYRTEIQVPVAHEGIRK